MSEPVFDPSALDHSSGGDAALRADLVRLFRNESAKLAERLDAALGTLDREELRAVAHRLSGSAGVVGARRLRTACGDLEEHIAAPPDELASLVARLLTAADQACKALPATGS